MAIAQTTLSAAIALAGTTSCTVRDVLGFAAATDTDDLVLIDTEFIRVTAGMGTTSWTISRGYAGSTAAAHSDGATVTRIERGWTDLARIKRLYGFTGTDDDARLLTFIAATNAELTERVGVFLGPATDTVRTYDGRDAVEDGRVLWIPGGIRTLTQVRIAETSGGTLATATLADFLLRPKTHELPSGSPFRWIEIKPDPAGDHSAFPAYLENVELTGTFGPGAVADNHASLADMVVMRMWEDRGAGTLTTPTPSKFIFADDKAMLLRLKHEHFPGIG